MPFLITIRVFRALFRRNVQSLRSRRSSSLICSFLRSFLRFFARFRPFLLWAEFLYISLRLRLVLSVFSDSTGDSDSHILPVCVHIVPRRILAHQVWVFLVCNFWERDISGPALAYCMTSYYVFLPSYYWRPFLDKFWIVEIYLISHYSPFLIIACLWIVSLGPSGLKH